MELLLDSVGRIDEGMEIEFQIFPEAEMAEFKNEFEFE
jgi:hypothetical protein